MYPRRGLESSMLEMTVRPWEPIVNWSDSDKRGRAVGLDSGGDSRSLLLDTRLGQGVAHDARASHGTGAEGGRDIDRGAADRRGGVGICDIDAGAADWLGVLGPARGLD